jgi:hypothetical protein
MTAFNQKFLRMLHGVKGGAVFSKSAPPVQVSAAYEPLQDCSELMLARVINQQALTFYL